MALLDQAGKEQVFRAIIRFWVSTNQAIGTKDTILGADKAIEKIDAWLDGNEGGSITVNDGLNSYLNATFKAWATTSQRSDLLIFVAARRRSVDILKLLHGDID